MFKWRTEEFSWVDFTIDVLRILIVLAVVVGSWNTLSSGRISFAQWLNLFVAGLSQGSIYALIALGYTLVYGILLMINFAHGEVFMAGAFSTVFLAEALNRIGFLNTQPLLSIMLMILFAGLISMTVAILLERIAYRPLRGSPRLVPLITAIGASFFLQYTFRGLYGSGFKAYPQVQALQGALRIGAIRIPTVQIFVFVSALILMLGLYWLVERTRVGKAMRAVSENKEVARLMGIDIDWVILFTFGVGGFLAGSAGVINGLFRPQGVNFFMGFIPGIKAFTAAVLGGIGNIPGAMLGGLFLGVIEAIGPKPGIGRTWHPGRKPAQRCHRFYYVGSGSDLPSPRYPRRTAVREESVGGAHHGILWITELAREPLLGLAGRRSDFVLRRHWHDRGLS